MTIEFYVSKSLRYTQARRFSRLPADFAVHLRTDEMRVNDRADDISEAGIKVRTARPLAPMTLVSMRLELPHLNESVDMLGRVMWATDHEMGIRFEHSEQRVSDVVEKLRQDYDRI